MDYFHKYQQNPFSIKSTEMESIINVRGDLIKPSINREHISFYVSVFNRYLHSEIVYLCKYIDKELIHINSLYLLK